MIDATVNYFARFPQMPLECLTTLSSTHTQHHHQQHRHFHVVDHWSNNRSNSNSFEISLWIRVLVRYYIFCFLVSKVSYQMNEWYMHIGLWRCAIAMRLSNWFENNISCMLRGSYITEPTVRLLIIIFVHFDALSLPSSHLGRLQKPINFEFSFLRFLQLCRRIFVIVETKTKHCLSEPFTRNKMKNCVRKATQMSSNVRWKQVEVYTMPP